ncbi:carboxymuconolactone decarboxylase family protein [Desulfocurvus sp.]|jgi:AhpD family alkylhydroperoxidase|uniref:carboxymuconolactone decarboxylase family protein n=1 Tax=Desulfocurvus sp. TaxID=2871698 RepID=UPI0025BAEEC4|nr:carboxymuconolactone decarboxylase family protein [Desulfocurvus sp.]MCK9241496.1 carboxymuconolactone decarboxylase family protein [Desulfocurvus sp.]
MSQLLDEFNATLKALNDETPDQLAGFMGFMKAAKADGAIPGKAKNLILVALAVANQCDWCIAVHVANAIKTGATAEEILEAAWLAVLMGGGPKLTYMKIVRDEIAANTK